MSKIYNQAKDENISGIIFYAKQGETDALYLDIDPAAPIKATYEQVVDAFNKRMLISMNNILYTPVSIENNFIIETSEWKAIITILKTSSGNTVQSYAFTIAK